MNGLNYDRLAMVTRTAEPYRGSLDRFPLFSRRENTKNFYVREANGVRVFDIVYGNRTKSTSLTYEEYLKRKVLGTKGLHEYTYQSEGRTEYWLYETVRHVMGTVYPEGYFQFNADINTYGQGDNAMLSRFSSGWFVNDSRRGGMVHTAGGSGGLRTPIFQGAKASTTEPFQLLDDYEVIGRKVNRKIGKEVLGGYETFMKTAETMCKAISRDVFLATGEEVLTEARKEIAKTGTTQYELAERMKNEAPLDAMILYSLAMDIGKLAVQINRPDVGWYATEPHEVFMAMKRHLNTRIYRENPEVFSIVRYGKGEAYPPSIWGYEIEVNGQKVQQY
jgi:hypothetical protein